MCSASGLLHWAEDHYENAADVSRYLVKGEKGYAAAWLTFTRPGWANWGDLTAKLQNPEPPVIVSGYDTMTVEYARRYHEATASVGFGSGRRFVKQVDLSHRRKIMDLGGGSGAYSIVAAQAYQQLSAVVFDLPPVVEVTGEFIAASKVGSQVSTQGGDFTKDELPENCDVAIMASNLPQYNREIIASVIRKTFIALLPGGEMHLIGEMLDDDRQGPLDAAIWGLSETMSNSTGVTHTRSDCVSYFNEAGFDDIQVHEFIPGILVRVCGTKQE
jgi:O-methyltransferase domain